MNTCNFCGRTQDQVKKLVCASGNSFICNLCIEEYEKELAEGSTAGGGEVKCSFCDSMRPEHHCRGDNEGKCRICIECLRLCHGFLEPETLSCVVTGVKEGGYVVDAPGFMQTEKEFTVGQEIDAVFRCVWERQIVIGAVEPFKCVVTNKQPGGYAVKALGFLPTGGEFGIGERVEAKIAEFANGAVVLRDADDKHG